MRSKEPTNKFVKYLIGMCDMQLVSPARQIIQYLIGLCVMSFGTVLIKKAEVGISPITCIPAAVSNVSNISMGNATIVLHILCVIAIFILMRKITLKVILMIPLGVAFGYFVDLFLWIFRSLQLNLIMRIAFCAAGLVVMSLGVALIIGADMMLPSPDALIRQVSVQFNKKYPIVKVIGDATWVIISIIIELVFAHTVISANVGTAASALLVGPIIGLIFKIFPKLTVKKE